MVSDALLDRDELPFDEWAVTPAPEHLIPDAIEHERESERFHEQLRIGTSEHPCPPVVITHTDADGLSAAALLVEHTGTDENTAVRPVSYHGAYQFKDALSDLVNFGIFETQIYITDFSPDEATPPDALVTLIDEHDCEVTWYDHHEWPDGARETHRDAGIELHIDTGECATSLLHRELAAGGGHGGSESGWPEHIDDLVAVTKDIDLWIRDDPRSPRLNTFASLVDDPWKYIDSVLNHGADHPPGIEQRIDDRIARNKELEAWAVENADTYDISPYTVATTYVKGGRSSEIGNELCENPEHGVDIAIVLKTHGGAGVYSHSDGQGENPDPDKFSRCHEIAGELGGGGHPTAAGFSVPTSTFHDLAWYWARAGKSAMDDVLVAAEAVINSEATNE